MSPEDTTYQKSAERDGQARNFSTTCFSSINCLPEGFDDLLASRARGCGTKGRVSWNLARYRCRLEVWWEETDERQLGPLELSHRTLSDGGFDDGGALSGVPGRISENSDRTYQSFTRTAVWVRRIY